MQFLLNLAGNVAARKPREQQVTCWTQILKLLVP